MNVAVEIAPVTVSARSVYRWAVENMPVIPEVGRLAAINRARAQHGLPAFVIAGQAALAKARSEYARDKVRGLRTPLPPPTPVARAREPRAEGSPALPVGACLPVGAAPLHALPIPPPAACQWPLWPFAGRPDGRFCGAPVERGSYCAAHAGVALTHWRPAAGATIR